MTYKGLYRHFKGGLYWMEDIALSSWDEEFMVVYRSVDDGKVWVRPLDEFFDDVDHSKYPDAVQEKRFERVKESCSSEK